MTTSSKRKQRDRIVRRGLAMMIESDFYTTPAGRAHFANQLQSIRYWCALHSVNCASNTLVLFHATPYEPALICTRFVLCSGLAMMSKELSTEWPSTILPNVDTVCLHFVLFVHSRERFLHHRRGSHALCQPAPVDPVSRRPAPCLFLATRVFGQHSHLGFWFVFTVTASRRRATTTCFSHT